MNRIAKENTAAAVSIFVTIAGWAYIALAIGERLVAPAVI